MEILSTIGEQFMTNVKEAPGWIPLVILCYLLAPELAPHYEKFFPVAVPVVAWLAYTLGDALDEAVFPRREKESPTGWKFLGSRSLTELQNEVKDKLKLPGEGYYDVSRSLTKAAKRYRWSWGHFYNETAKFIRSLVVPGLLLGIALLFFREWLWAAVAFAAAPVGLFVYAFLKREHMKGLYAAAREIARTDQEKYSAVSAAGTPIRLFFWDNALVGIAEVKPRPAPSLPVSDASHRRTSI